MQLKLLNFYKMMAKIAGNLVGAFVPLIIYEATQSIIYATLFLAGVSFARLVLNYIFCRLIQKYPEIFLMLRFFTMGLYCLCLSFLASNLLLFAILCAIFLGADRCFMSLANETLFNYSTGAKVDSKKIGVTRIFERLGVFAGLIVGGLLLDVNQIVVYVLSVILYFIAIIPLFMYYLKNKKNKSFNTELVSNAVMFMSESEENVNKSKSVKYIGTMVLLCYSIVYFCYAMCDLSTNIFNLSMFVDGSISYSYASMFVLAFNIAEFVANLIIGKIERKFDLLNVVRVGFFILSGLFVCLAFVKNITIIFICFALFGIVYAFICAFVLQRLLQKSRIIGVSNKAFVTRERASLISYIVFYIVATIIACANISITLFFLVSATMMILCGFFVPYIEEKTRKMLVDYIEDNDIIVEGHAKKVSEDNEK